MNFHLIGLKENNTGLIGELVDRVEGMLPGFFLQIFGYVISSVTQNWEI